MERNVGEKLMLVLDERLEQRLPRQQKAVALPLVAQRVSIGLQCPGAPRLIFRGLLGRTSVGGGGEGVFGHDAELAIEQTDALPEGNEFARHRIVATHQVRAFAAGDFQTGGANIVLPRLAFRKNNALARRFPTVGALVAAVEHVGTSEPGFVDKVVLRIANPGRGEDFGHLLGAVELLFARLEHPRLNHAPVFARDALGRDRIVPLIADTQVGIVVGGPEDGTMRRVVEQ